MINARVRITCYLGISLFLLFNLLDWIIYPDLALKFLLLRLLLVIIHASVLVLTFTVIGKKHPTALGVIAYTAAGWILSFMVVLSGGHESPYYAGLNLVILGFSLLMPWTLRDALLTFSLIYGSYFGLILMHERVQNVPVFINNNFFVIATGAIAIVSSMVWQSFRERQFIDNQQLKLLDQSKSNFLATISHELKTPMTLIVNPIEQAWATRQGKEVVLDERQAEIVKRNTYRLATLVGDLLEISRGEVGKQQLVPSDVLDVRAYISDIATSMRPLFEEKGILLTVQLTSDIKQHYFDIKKIDKAIYNLLSNALKFTPKGGQVNVKAFDDAENNLIIEVDDTGIGIPSNKRDKVFERFAQVEEGVNRSYEGMGIGLSLVKDFIEQHGGEINLKSELGKGSTFTIKLPRGAEHFRAPVVRSDASRPMSEQRLDFTRVMVQEKATAIKNAPSLATTDSINETGKTILVVEDNPDIRETIARALGGEYRVVTASNGQEGLEKAREAIPWLILSDIMMPVMDGYQMTQEIRADNKLKDIPIVLLTAKVGEDSIAEGFRVGATDYLTKPFSPLELSIRVRNHIQTQEMRNEVIRQRNLASVGQLSAGISHNMNTYAGSVALSLHLAKNYLEKNETNDIVKKEISRKLSDAQTGLKSIKDMIAALEVHSQKNIEGFKEDDITVTTRAVIEMAKTSVPSHVDITYDAPDSVKCYYNPHILNPAILNLIDNASYACKERARGSIRVSLFNDDDDKITIKVADNGSGIPEEIQARVWDPYFTTKGVGSGTGLGLWMVHQAVEKDHRGTIQMSSSSEGTTFTIAIPKRREKHNVGEE